ncbi:MAG: hypothetical protein GAK30_01362 [Paracidovorax wautersii]|uniref:Uncharacterized protein n=1 Tax=Paracidovorax wautersii TaxID=1177982 RepID=A0A7V8FPX9_9BURK|nr:MAG: hypothetical protein GAK30_01362 [Paracidovorax wautersii]
MQGINGLPVAQIEARVVRYTALTGLTTMGRQAEAHARTLERAERDRLRNAERGLQRSAYRMDPTIRAPHARAAALAGLFDASLALLKGAQMLSKPDARTSWEMVGATLQGVGSIMDWRAKAYEETILKGVQGTNVFKVKAMQESMDALNALTLKGMRLTALKFLGPAALISMVLDGMDAFKYWSQKRIGMSLAQSASALGTAFTVAGSIGAMFALPGTFWAVVAAGLGVLGAVLVIGALIAMWIFSEEDWVTWLREIPLSKNRKEKISVDAKTGEPIYGKPRKPGHADLQTTLQKLADAQAAI